MAVTWQSQQIGASGAATPVTSRTITKPTGTVDGDILGMTLAWAGDPGTITLPSVWTELETHIVAGEMCVKSYVRIASSEPANYLIQWTNARAVLHVIERLTGGDTSAPVTDSSIATSNASAGTAVSVPGVTLNGRAHLLVMRAVCWDQRSFTTPMTEFYDAANTNGPSMLGAREAVTSTSPGAKTATINSSSRWTAVVVAYASAAEQGSGELELEGSGELLMDGEGALDPVNPGISYLTHVPDRFGDGNWQVYTADRGGQVVNHEVRWSGFSFSYVLNSAASYNCAPVLPQRQMLNETEPFQHELNFYRDDFLAECGPLVMVQPDQLSGYDLFYWLEKRFIDEDLFFSSDFALTWQRLAEYGIDKDPSINLSVISRPIGLEGVRHYFGKDFPKVADQLRELGRSVLDFTTRERTIYVGDLAALLPSEPLLLHDEGVMSVKPVKDGSVFATDVGVFGATLRSTPDPVYGRATRGSARYGLVQESFAELPLADNESCEMNALARLHAMQPAPRRLTVEVSPNAAFRFEDLICGRVFQNHLSEDILDGLEMEGDLILRQVNVSVSAQSESITLDLMPLGLTLAELVGELAGED